MLERGEIFIGRPIARQQVRTQLVIRFNSHACQLAASVLFCNDRYDIRKHLHRKQGLIKWQYRNKWSCAIGWTGRGGELTTTNNIPERTSSFVGRNRWSSLGCDHMLGLRINKQQQQQQEQLALCSRTCRIISSLFFRPCIVYGYRYFCWWSTNKYTLTNTREKRERNIRLQCAMPCCLPAT